MGISAHPERLRHLKTYHMDDIVEILEDRLNKSEGELAQIHTPPRGFDASKFRVNFLYLAYPAALGDHALILFLS